MTSSTPDPMIDRLIDGRYQVRSRVARGGMATVYLATDLRLDRRVALKIMHGHLADDSTFKTRFVQEARSAARLAHPNVVNVFDQGQDSDMAYLVMEYLPGFTLRQLLKDYGTLTTEQTLDIMHAVLSGLAAAHKAGIVHRDLKPENVLLADDGRIKIADFGLARAATANTATGQALLGTIAYLSPELVTRGIADARSDIYALGIMMFEMLTGEQPYQGEQPMTIAYQHANDSVPAPSTKNPAVPAELDELVLWATAREPDDRPAEARQMLDRLIEVEKHLRTSDRTAVLPTSILPAVGAYAATTVIPTNATDETQVIGQLQTPAVAAAVAPSDPAGPNASALVAKTQTRRRKGYWLFALVLLLAAAAAGTGLYFSAGPGGRIAVPEVTQLPQAEAEAQLLAAGLTVTTPTECTDPTLPLGSVVRSDPEPGTAVAKESAVELCLSIGPAMVAVPDVTGQPEADARSALWAFTVGDSVREYSDAEAGVVLRVTDASGTELAPDSTYGEQQPVTMVVSAGAIPGVQGMGPAEARETLESVGLTVASDAQNVFSDSVDEGLVIQAITQTDPVRVGDPVILQVSKGPELFEVPSVIGSSLSEAKRVLQNAGFSVDYPAAADPVADFVVVSSMNPGPGEMLRSGSTITLTLTLGF